jgi:hypothetical protein
MIAGDMLRCLPYAWRELEQPAGGDEPASAPGGHEGERTGDEEE